MSSDWTTWFCIQRGNEFLCEVSRSYIEDRFNLTNLNYEVDDFKEALDVIEDIGHFSEEEDQTVREAHEDEVDTAAEMLYGLIHARFILTNQGIDKMVEKWTCKEFGSCPRVFCASQALLPIDESFFDLLTEKCLGLTDEPGQEYVKVFCPRCNDVFVPRMSKHRGLDGAYFGTGFPHMFFFVHPELRPSPPKNSFEPRLFGFKIHSSVMATAVDSENEDVDE